MPQSYTKPYGITKIKMRAVVLSIGLVLALFAPNLAGPVVRMFA